MLRFRIVAIQRSMVGNYSGIGIPVTTMDIMFSKEFEAKDWKSAKSQAMRIVRKSEWANKFVSMKNWGQGNKTLKQRQSLSSWAHYLHLIKLEE